MLTERGKDLKYLTSLLLLLPALALAADPCPECRDEMVIDDVSGGLATSIPSHKLSKSFSPNLRNVIIDGDKIEQIKGFTVAGSSMTLQKITGIFPYYLENGQTQFLVSDSSIVLETSDFNSYVFVSSGHNTGVLLRCKQIENKMWCSNGVDSVFTWDHSVKSILDGTKGTPNVPKGKYIEYYHDRVWMANLPNDASVIRFSDVRSTNGVIISPDNYLAWPGGNALYAGRGDGQIITATWLENGQLKFGKERSIYTLFGTNAGSYLPRLSNPSVGVASHDSIVQLDNQTHFLGHDGIYRGEKRISDLIEDESNAIDRSGVKTVFNSWETQSDFSDGQFYGSTATAGGLLTHITNEYGTLQNPSGIDSLRYVFASGMLQPNPGSVTLTPGTSFYGPYQLTFEPGQIPDSTRLYVNKIIFSNNENIGSCSMKFATFTIYNGMTGELQQSTVTTFSGSGLNSNAQVPFAHPYPLFNGFEINNSSLAIKIEGCGIEISAIGTFGISFLNATTAQYVSEISTITTLSAWSTFESERNTNGGLVRYYFRSSTSVINIATQTWQGISLGVRIDAPALNKYFQWASTIQSINYLTNQTNIDNVEVGHIEGAGAINRAFAIPWMGRYWLAFSTSADPISSSILIKSKITNKNPDAWMPVSGINIRAFAKDQQDTLYGGSSSTGIIYRLDNGNNFNGSPIVSYYEVPFTSFGDLVREKNLLEYFVTAERRAGSSFTLGTAIDTGTFTTTSVSLDGSGLLNRSIKNVRGKGKLFRWYFLHSIYDEPFVLHNFAVNFQPTRSSKGKDD